MKKLLFVVIIFLSSLNVFSQSDSVMLRKIFNEIMINGKGYDQLNYLCKNIGHRLSGSPQAERAVQWAKAEMENAGFDNVWLQEVMVPHWIRGQKEYGEIVGVGQVDILALGGSVATSKNGLIANVIEVRDFDELKQLGAENVNGKIIFYNHVFPQNVVNSFEGYGDAGPYRWYGPAEASKLGAVATITRSVSSAYDDFPHTGTTGFRDEAQPIPCVAISTMDADVLSDALEKNLDTKVKLVLHCEMLDEVKSYNVIGEITGSEFPNEIIVVGGHLDSWDVGEGAHDDGAGCVQSMEVIRALKALNIRPKRTIRCVLFMNEENGVRGGNKYGEYAKSHATEKHVAAIESDAGGFSPRGFSIEASSAVIRKIADAKNIFLPYGLYTFPEGHSGTDIEPLKDAGTALFGLVPDSQRYMDLHHTANDTFDKINKRELHSGAAAMAMFAWWLSENGL